MQVQRSGYSPMPIQTVAIMPPPPPPGKRMLRCLSIFQIIIGTILIFCGILANGLLGRNDPITVIGGPIWGGCWIMVTGVIGIKSSQSGTFIVFNIISSVVSFSTGWLFGIGGIIYYAECDWSYYRLTGNCFRVEDSSGLGLYITLIALMLLEFVISIIAAAFSCKYTACCCPQRNRDDMTQLLPSYLDHASTAGYPVTSHSDAYHPTSSYPQHTRVMTYPIQMVSQLPPGGTYVVARGQQMPAQTYSSQMVSQPSATGANVAPQGRNVPAYRNPSQMLSQPETSGAYVAAQGQQIPVQTYSSQMVSQPSAAMANVAPQGRNIPAQTNPSQMISQPEACGTDVATHVQEMPVQTYSSQMISQPAAAGGADVAAQGQTMPAQTNIVYSAQSTDSNTVPPPYKDLLDFENDIAPPLEVLVPDVSSI